MGDGGGGGDVAALPRRAHPWATSAEVRRTVRPQAQRGRRPARVCDPSRRCCRVAFLAFGAHTPAVHWHERVPLAYGGVLARRCCAREYEVFRVGGGADGAPVVVVDNLLCELPTLLKKHVFGRSGVAGSAPRSGLKATFRPSGLAFPGLDAEAPTALRREVERCLAPIVSEELGVELFRIPHASASAFLRVLTKPQASWTSSQVFPHIDYAATVAATVGLGAFRGTGLGFYSARVVRPRRTVLQDMRDIAMYKVLGIGRFAEERDSASGHATHRLGSQPGLADDFRETAASVAEASTHFELLLARELLENRAVAYPAWLLHRAEVPDEVADRLVHDPRRGRLALNLFYAADEHPVRLGAMPSAEPSNEDLMPHLPASKHMSPGP